MSIKLNDIGKKFDSNWIFKNLNFEVGDFEKTAITGRNGAGKSTLLQIVAGYLSPSKGTIENSFSLNKINYTSPNTEIIEEFTLEEFLKFHLQFKKTTFQIEEMAELAKLPLKKIIAQFSTGMKQRAKLITSFYFDDELILMDEPTANLDNQGINWWKSQLEKFNNKTYIIASNIQEEIKICGKKIIL